MTDLHTHILYGIDDGSENIEMSVEMIKMAKNNGTNNIVLTPHCNIPDAYTNYMNDVIVGRFEKLKRTIKEMEIDVNLYLGMEVYASDNIDRLIMDGAIITLNRSRYLLIEFPFMADPLWVTHILAKVHQIGLIPLLAHPERYIYVQEFPYMVFDWVNSGCLLQINRGSIVGRFGDQARDIAIMLMENNMVTAVASDAHSPYKRTPILNDAYDWVSKHFGSQYAQKIFVEKPTMLLNDQPIKRRRKEI